MAPEMMKDENYSFLVDIWSLGIICRELAEGKPPYADYLPIKAMYFIVNKGIPDISLKDAHSSEFLDFLDKCLDSDPKKRLSATELLNHPFLSRSCNQTEIPTLIQEAQQLINVQLLNEFDDFD